ncbi:hypothetical protein [Micromonospora sp. WMMD998]|uniref:hypothetical protein n=1 Tax=Micromonospora sp. WMMD998 TaxID=3016092 RepID=UPI00249C2800|nr:hypothetical protein [Micromonospora sp. WMMD998]WFE41966.1 hypothetical protein O7619_27360 [Micromonospora sp. WMMD998]
MAAPDIVSATIDPPAVYPGQSGVIKVVARDADARILYFDIKVSDQAGNSVDTRVPWEVMEELTTEVTCTDPNVLGAPASSTALSSSFTVTAK